MAKFFTLFDSKAGYYLPPFLARSEAEAKRIVANIVDSNRELAPSKYPADFTLFCIGAYNDETGMLCPETFVNLGNVLQVWSSLRREPAVVLTQPDSVHTEEEQ